MNIKTNIKKAIAYVSLPGIIAALAIYSNVGATTLNVGNDTSSRANLDSYSNFIVVDTNHPVSALGQLSTFNYYAANLGSFRFVLVDSVSNEVTWESDLITPSATGEQSYVPAVPVIVHTGDNVGLYFEASSSIPFENTGNASFYTANHSGLPSVGAVLSYEGTANRTYSFSATGIVGELPSVPEISSPTNNATLASASFAFVDWTDSTGTFDPMYYQFEMYSSATYAPSKLVSSSSWQTDSQFSTLNTAEGTYFLRVRAKDSIGNVTEWSNSEANPFKVTVKNPEPTPTPTPTETPTPTPTPSPSVTPTPTPSPTDHPTAKDDCKKGGWEKFTEILFRNQGQCVSHVNGRDDNHGQHVKNSEDKQEAAHSDIGIKAKIHIGDDDDQGEDNEIDD